MTRATGIAMLTVAIAALGFGAAAQAAQLNVSTSHGPSSIGPRAPSISTVGPRIDPHFGRGSIGATGNPGSGDTAPVRLHTKKSTSGGNGQSSQAGIASLINAPSVADEILLEFNRALTDDEANALARRHGLTRLQAQTIALTNTTLVRWKLNGQAATAVSRALLSDDGAQALGLSSVQLNHLFTANQAQPAVLSEGDPAQYTLAKLHLPLAHSLARGDKVLVAVIDSGVDVTHPELAGVIADSFDALNNGEPSHAHGTAIAGAIAAHARLQGVAPAAHILAIRAFGVAANTAEGTTFNVLRGLDWAVAHGARIINMSFTGPNDPALHRALAAARQKGAILIAAAGNAGPKSPPLYPAADPNVIAVTATDAEDRLFPASNRGLYIAVAAPGVDILLPAPGGSYQITSGTSFAAAHVSGVAALILERRPDLAPDAVRKILIASCKDLGPKGRDDQFGAGLADAYKAVVSLGPTALETSANAPARR
jgi:hypothetical protein